MEAGEVATLLTEIERQLALAGEVQGAGCPANGSFSIAAEVKALSLCHAYSFPRKLCVLLISLHGARASLRGRRGAAS